MTGSVRLELVDVRQQFGRVAALDGVYLALPSHGVVATVGPNGAGKTTLLDVLCGALRPSRGRVSFVGGQVRLSAGYLYRYFGRLHQRLVIPADLAVLRYLGLACNPGRIWTLPGMLARRWSFRRDLEKGLTPWAWRLLCAAEIDGSLDMPIGALSYGQQRVVAMIAVLSVPGRHGILLDEPFAGLADTTKAALRVVIAHYAIDRLVVLAEHDLDTVREVADVMVVLVGGKIVASYEGEAVRSADLLGHFFTGVSP